MRYKRAPEKSGSTRTWCVVWLKKAQSKQVVKRKIRKVVAKEDV